MKSALYIHGKEIETAKVVRQVATKLADRAELRQIRTFANESDKVYIGPLNEAPEGVYRITPGHRDEEWVEVVVTRTPEGVVIITD